MKPCLLRRADTKPSTARYLAGGQAFNTVFSRYGKLVLSLCLVFVIHYQTNALAQNSGRQAANGSTVFLKYCAGCHGFDGFAEYEFAPSFSMGDRLYRSDEELLRSVIAGRHAMPYWKHKLSIDMLRSAIAYLRVMQQRHSSGLPPREEPIPETYYRFNPVGEDEDYWLNR
jgi:mono/diheme cytochrome c family protein